MGEPSPESKEVTVLLEGGRHELVDTDGVLCNKGKLCRWHGIFRGFDWCTLFDKQVYMYLMYPELPNIYRLPDCIEAEERAKGVVKIEEIDFVSVSLMEKADPAYGVFPITHIEEKDDDADQG